MPSSTSASFDIRKKWRWIQVGFCYFQLQSWYKRQNIIALFQYAFMNRLHLRPFCSCRTGFAPGIWKSVLVAWHFLSALSKAYQIQTHGTAHWEHVKTFPVLDLMRIHMYCSWLWIHRNWNIPWVSLSLCDWSCWWNSIPRSSGNHFYPWSALFLVLKLALTEHKPQIDSFAF